MLLLVLLGLAGHACATGLKVGIYENEPKIFTDSRGTASGILIDILEAVAKRENWQLSYVHCEWEDCLKQLQAGTIDLMPDVAYSEERDRLFDFHSTPALHSWSQIYRRDDVEINSAIDLAGKRIALLGGGIQESAISDMLAGLGIKATLIRTKSVEDGFRLAQANGADAAIAGHYFGDYHKQMYRLTDTPVIFQSSRLFYVTAQGRHPDLLAALEKHLAAWNSDPKSPYYEAIRKWGGHVPDSLIPPAVWKTLLAVTALLLISILGVVVLRKRVHLKTRKPGSSPNQTGNCSVSPSFMPH
ncbi:MAG TPA: transporter substrate-binding domain-containing protein [Sideroxyarcus sp.]|nr:transporter substrate-binding domain-containing protein [Sideroxyarcus sp.]